MTLARLATNILRGPGAVFLCAAALALVPPEGASGEPSAGFVPGELVSIPATSDVLVLGTAPCAARSCVQLWRVSAGGHGLTPLAVPPGESASGPGLVEGAHLVFANVDDGYALTSGEGARSWYTTDGGLAWHRLPTGRSGTLVSVVASGGAFYRLLGSCATLEDCRYRLGRSAVTSPHWSSVPIPGAVGLVQGNIDLAARGSEVWLSFEPHFKPVLAKSHDGRPPFSERPAPQLLGVVGCSLDPEDADIVWAECPTGMMVSWSRSTDGGARFTHWWETSGTGGNAFDPLSATVAYRYTGIGPGPAYLLQRTTDGGASFTTVGRLFQGEGTTPRFAFSDEDHGFALSANELGKPGFQFLYTSDGGRQWRPVFNS
ncbi:MAG: hypothetical protein ABSE77_19090 [Acidimicrobiales bacterium]|jgi:hypothetical protein